MGTSFAEQKRKAKAYVEAINRPGGKFDVVLVDGRWRVACGLQALQFVSASSRVLVHDFFEEDAAKGGARSTTHAGAENKYETLLRWYDLVAQAQELAILAPRRTSLEAALTKAANYTQALEAAYPLKGMAA